MDGLAQRERLVEGRVVCAAQSLADDGAGRRLPDTTEELRFGDTSSCLPLESREALVTINPPAAGSYLSRRSAGNRAGGMDLRHASRLHRNPDRHDRRTSPRPTRDHAPINQFVHYRAFPDASNRTVVGFNVDTLYSLAQAGSLDKSRWSCRFRRWANRFWIMQIIDAWNNVPHAPGSRTVGGKGGHFAIVGPTWKGTLPEGVTELRVPTNLALHRRPHVHRRP